MRSASVKEVEYTVKKWCLVILLVIVCISSYSVLAKTGFSKAQLKNPELNPGDGFGWMGIAANITTTFEIGSDEVAVRSVTFSLTKKVDQGVFTVSKLLTLPDRIPPLIGTAYETTMFKFSGFTYKDIGLLKLKFRVRKDFLINNKLVASDIKLYESKGYNEETWDVIDNVEVIGEDDTYYQYSSTIHPSNFFLITFFSSANTVTNVIEVKSVEESKKDNTNTNTQINSPEEEVINIVGPADVETVPVQESPEPSLPALNDIIKEPSQEQQATIKKGFYDILIVFVLSFVVLILIINHKKLKFLTKKTVDKELHKYIKECKNTGRTKEEIKHRLVSVGWDKEKVEKILEDY